MAELTPARLEGRIRVLTVALLSALELANSDGPFDSSQLESHLKNRFSERYPISDGVDDKDAAIEQADIFDDCVRMSDWLAIPRDFSDIDEFPWGL